MTMGSRTSPEDGLLSLKWNNHRSTFLHILTGLRDKPLHSDVTLACSGELFPVHKLVLSSCSTYFASMFASTHCQHPVIVLKDIHKDELEALLDYMYIGEVDVKQSALEPLIRAAECLHIKGLAAPDEELPSTRGPTTAGRGNSGGGDRRSTSNSSNQQQQQQQANCVGVGASSRGSKRGGGANSGPSDDDDPEDGPCSAVIKRRRRGSCSSPGVVSAENGSSSSVTSVSVSYSTLSRGSRARGTLESTPQQHTSSVTPKRDNARTSSLDDPHSRIQQQQTPSKGASHQQSQHNTHHAVDDTIDHSDKIRQDVRVSQPTSSPVTSEGSSYGAASSSSQLLPSQVIKVELDDERGGEGDGGEGGGEEDKPREGSGKQPKERMDNRDGNHGAESDSDHMMYNESLNIVKVEEDEMEGRSRHVEGTGNCGGASSSKAEAESRPSTDWSGGKDRSSAPLGDDSNTTKGPWCRGGNDGGREDTRGGGGGSGAEFKNKNSSHHDDDGDINVTPYLREDQDDEDVGEEKYDPPAHLEDDVADGDPRSNNSGDEEEYYEDEDEEDDDISVLRDDARIRVAGNNQLLSRTMLDNLQSLGLAAFPQHHLSDSSSSKLNFSSSLSQLLEASLENSAAPLVPHFEPYEEGFRLGSSSFSQDRAFPSNLTDGQWRTGSNRSISIKRGLQATTSFNNRPAKLLAAPEHRPRQELHPLTGLSLQMSPSSSVTISGPPPPLPSLHALTSSARDSQRAPTQHHQITNPGSLLSPPSSGLINLSSNQSSNIGHLASPTARGGNHHHHNQARPQQRQVSPSDGGSAPDGPLFCPFCGKLCKRRDHLRVHIRIHTGEKPFQCPYCERRTNQKNNLKLHIRNVHPGLSANV